MRAELQRYDEASLCGDGLRILPLIDREIHEALGSPLPFRPISR